jgi:hypothetical protein
MPKKSPSAQPARPPSLRAVKAKTDHLLNAACLFFSLHTRVEPIDSKLELRGDLLLESDKVEALALALTTISLGHRGELVSKNEVSKCVTVGDIAAIVHRRARAATASAKAPKKEPKATRASGKKKGS